MWVVCSSEDNFEVDLLSTLSGAMMSCLDNFFRVSNEYGHISEVKVGSFGYVLILLVLYCRYLVQKKQGQGELNHGLRLNVRCTPVCRLLLDVDIDNSVCTEEMVNDGLRFLLWTVMHFVEPGSRVLLTRNCSVPNTRSFHLITETQFDVVSCEMLRAYCLHQVQSTMKVDIVNMWTMPHGRYHVPETIYTCSDVLSTNSYKDSSWLLNSTPAADFLSFDDWLLMAPINVFSIDSTYSILEEMSELPTSHGHYCIMTTNLGPRYLSQNYLLSNLNEDIGSIRRSKNIKFIKYIRHFSNAISLSIPRQSTNANWQVVMDSFCINISALRLLFSNQCKQAFTAMTVDLQHNVLPNAFEITDLRHPHEFYEVLLYTKYKFIDNYNFKDVFGNFSSAAASDTNRLNASYTKLCESTFHLANKVKEFQSQKFTFTFRPLDVHTLYNCYFKLPEDNVKIVDIVCNSIWRQWDSENKYTSAIIKALYLYRCQRLAVPVFISEHEYLEFTDFLSSTLGIRVQLNVQHFNGHLPHTSPIGMVWDRLSNYSSRILLHCLYMSLQANHTFATLSLVVRGRSWEDFMIKNAITFLLNLFAKDSFISASADVDMNINSDRPVDIESVAPLQTLFLFARYFQDVPDNGFLPVLLNTFQFEFMAKFLFTFDDETGQGEDANEVLDNFLKLFSFNTDAATTANTSDFADEGRPPAKKKSKKSQRGASQFNNLYSSIMDLPDVMLKKFVVQHIVPMHRREFFHFVYNVDRYKIDDHMPEEIRSIITEVKDPESREYTFWYRREIGIYNSYYGTFDAHSPSLYSGVYIETPSFMNNTNHFNMFDFHFRNRMFNVLMKGIHFCDALDYQRTALILCGSIYPPSRSCNFVEFSGEVFSFAVSSLQVSRMDVKSNLPCPRQLILQIYNTSLLKRLYFWMYLIICEMSQMITIEVFEPSKYIFASMDPNSDSFNVGSTKNTAHVDEEADDLESEHYTAISRDFMRDSFVIQSLTSWLYKDSTATTEEDDSPGPAPISYLHRLVPSKMQKSNWDEFSPYLNMAKCNIFDMDEMWLNTMNMEPSEDVMKLSDIDEIIRSHILDVGGPEFELFILLLVSWHIRTVHTTPFSSTRYMTFVKAHRKELYAELLQIVEHSIGPFFSSIGHTSLVEYFRRFTEMTRIEVDSLSFHLSPPAGFVLPTRDTQYIGDVPCPDDTGIHEGVVSLIVQSQLNKETMVDFLKLICKCTRPVNRERISLALLNRMRSGKNVLVDELVQNVFKSNQQNSFRSHELISAESENVGNKLYLALNRNLLVSFDEVTTLPNVFKVICNNGCVAGRPLFTEGYCNLWINAHPILCSNSDPICKETAVIDRVRVFDRFYQFTSLNIDAIFPRKDAIHDINTQEINDVFAIQNLLQVLPKESTSVCSRGLYLLIWHMAPLFAYTQTEPCTQRLTSQMQKTMTRFFNATDPAKYIISHKIVQSLKEPITIQAFKGDIQTVVAQDKTIPRSTNFNLNGIIHDILDRLQAYIYTDDGIEYIKMKVST